MRGYPFIVAVIVESSLELSVDRQAAELVLLGRPREWDERETRALVHVIEGKPRRRLAVLVEGDCSASMTMARGEINGILAEQFSRPKGIITAPS